MGRYWRRLRVAVIAGDILAVLLAYRSASDLRFGLTRVRLGLWPVYPVLAAGVALLTVLLGWQHGVYRRWALPGGHRVYPKLVAVATYNLIAVMVLSYLLGGPPLVSRAWLLWSWLVTIVLLSGSRLLCRRLALHWQGRGYLVHNVLIVGANQHGIAVAQQLHNPGMHGRRVVGFLDDYQRPGTEVLPGVPVVGHPSALLEIADDLAAEEVIVVANALSWESQREIAELVTTPGFPLDARISPTFYDLLTTSAELSHVGYVPMLTLQSARLVGPNAVLKGLVDIGVSGLLLVMLAPAFLYWRIKATVRGTPMLRQEAVLGAGGETFEVVGLYPGLSASPVLGRLPALWNVFCRDLSLVGPRPIRAGELSLHERWLANLFAMRPGLTGLWRVRGSELPTEERVALDLYYIRNYTLSTDGQILLNTFRQLARRFVGREYRLARWLPLEAEEVATRARDSAAPVAEVRARGANEGVSLGVRG